MVFKKYQMHLRWKLTAAANQDVTLNTELSPCEDFRPKSQDRVCKSHPFRFNSFTNCKINSTIVFLGDFARLPFTASR